MWAFFHGWRRKVGCVTLVVACVFTSAWLRSFTEYREIWSYKPNEARIYDIWLWEDGFRFNQRRVTDPTDIFGFETEWRIVIPHWFAIPLTLLSAYLILWKPRQSPKPNAGA